MRRYLPRDWIDWLLIAAIVVSLLSLLRLL
jgi:hypothetical protein